MSYWKWTPRRIGNTERGRYFRKLRDDFDMEKNLDPASPEMRALTMLAEYTEQCRDMNLSLGDTAGFAFAAGLYLIEQYADRRTALKWAQAMAETAEKVLDGRLH